jgi:methionyl-tRNA synthetase
MSAWITATPPTPNGPLHVGHMAGPYIAADVLRRALVQQGRHALMTTGLDDNQSYVPRRAWLDAEDPADLAARFTDSITRTWSAAGVHFDDIVVPRGTTYDERVRAMFRQLFDAGAIVPRDTQLPFCEGCDLWLYEAFLSGSCPHCGEGTNGNACEGCCRPNSCYDVLDPRCIRCDASADLRPVELLVLPLENHREELVKYWDSVDMPPRLRRICDAMAQDGLPEILVSHPSDWGIPVPVAGFEEHRIYVWLEMAEGYAVERPDLPSDTPLVQFFGIDNGYFHAVLFPAVNLALGRPELLAHRFVVNEFFLLNGKKFSTSRQHAVWAETFLPFAGRDLTRLHCCLRRPASTRSDFTLADLATTEAVLNRWESLFRGVCAYGRAPFESDAPSEELLGLDLRRHSRRVADALAAAGTALTLEDFDPVVAATSLVLAGERLAALAAEVAHTSGEPRRGGEAVVVQHARAFAAAASCVVPDGGTRLTQWLVAGEAEPGKLFGLGV